MPKHVKPTKEELNEKIKEVIDETKAVDETPSETPVEEKIVVPKEPEEEPEVKEEPQAEPSEEVKEKLRVELEEKKQKLSASARENQKIYAKNRIINKALVEAEDVTEPTEKEMEKAYREWDVMSDTEKDLAREVVISRRFRETISKAKAQATKIEKWNESVESFIGDPKTLNDNPELEGKEDDFVDFASKEEHNSVPFNILVSAFLHDRSTKEVKHKGKMFETGSGGPNEKPTPTTNKISLEESRKLRENDYNKWKQYVKEGRIESAF